MLDSGPVGMITNPKITPPNVACARWFQGLLNRGVTIYLPEIVDFEVRRELLRAQKPTGIQRLDELADVVQYLPLTTEAMRQAAGFWAQARQQGRPTASDTALDADVILAAQACGVGVDGVVVATTNPNHLSRFVPTALWSSL